MDIKRLDDTQFDVTESVTTRYDIEQLKKQQQDLKDALDNITTLIDSLK